MKKVTAYQCEFCKDPRLFLSRSGCKNHENKCWLNPKRKSCATCLNVLDQWLDTGTKKWSCIELKNVTPFKQKIEGCPYWEASEEPFNNDPYEGELA